MDILNEISDVWEVGGLGTYEKSIGFYVVRMRQLLSEILYYGFTTERVLWIMAYNWALLHWKASLPGSDPEGGPIDYQSPYPKEGELDAYGLQVDGIDWATLDDDGYTLLIDTYLSGYEVNWTAENETQARYLFTVCKNYLEGI
jgi:hypothetical protein